MSKYKGRTALVTGASKGLGLAFAEALARQGSNLILVARSGDALQLLAQRLQTNFGVTCTVVTSDLGVPDAAAKLVSGLDARGISVDLLVNNAGLGLSGPFLSHDMALEQASVQLNIQALIGLSHLLGAKMSERGTGGIINIASNAAFQPLPFMAVYAASKAFVLSFTEALRYELAGSGVEVMVACPGPTATHFFDGVRTTMKVSSFDPADVVAERTLTAFAQGVAVAYPGRFSIRAATWASRVLPRGLAVKIAGSATKRMGLEKA